MYLNYAIQSIDQLGDNIIYIYIYICIYIYIYITYDILPIDCLLVSFDPHMFSHNGRGPGTKAQKLLDGAWGPATSGPRALVPGPYPL